MIDSATPHRLFLALWPHPAACQALAQATQHWSWPGAARVYAPTDWHVTLHFLGAVPPATVGALHTLAQDPVLGACAPMELVLSHIDHWAGGLVVLRCEPEPALLTLHARLAERLHALGMPTDPRPYHPHLTLARKAAGVVADASALPLRMRVGQVALAASTGSVSGRYRILAAFQGN